MIKFAQEQKQFGGNFKHKKILTHNGIRISY